MEILHSPEHAFSRDLSGPSYVAPFLILSLISVLLSFLQLPIQIHWTQFHLESSGASADQIAGALGFLHQSSRLSAVAVPVFLFARWLFFSVLLWLTVQVAFCALDFQQTVTLVSYSYFPITLRDAIIFLNLKLRPEQALLRADGLSVALGLDLLCPSIALPWSSLAGNLNPFEFWYVTLLVAGISKAIHCSRRRALAIVVPCWLFVSLLQLALAYLGLHLRSYVGLD